MVDLFLPIIGEELPLNQGPSSGYQLSYWSCAPLAMLDPLRIPEDANS